MFSREIFALAVTLSGLVPVKMAPDSEAITHPGMAMKATRAGYTVGKALENCNEDSPFLGGIHTGSDIKEERTNSKNSTGKIEEQETNVGLIENHNLTSLTNLNATNQEKIDAINPNTTTIGEGLSREVINKGSTVEPKNKVPTLTNTPDNFSSWASDKETVISTQNNTTVNNLSRNATGINLAAVFGEEFGHQKTASS